MLARSLGLTFLAHEPSGQLTETFVNYDSNCAAGQ